MSDPQLPFFYGVSYLNRFTMAATVFLSRSRSRTYSEEKPVEEIASRVNAKLLRGKPRLDDFHTSSGNHFIAKLFWWRTKAA
jgi:hypothetical protein